MTVIKSTSGEEVDLPVLTPVIVSREYSSYTPYIPPLRQRARNDGMTTDTRQERRALSASPLLVPTLWWVGRPGYRGS